MTLPKFWLGNIFKNTSLIDFQELQLKNEIKFCFLILNIVITFENVRAFFRDQLRY